MKRVSLCATNIVIVAICGGMIPACADLPPDVHVCGAHSSQNDERHYTIGRPERHQRTVPAQVEDVDENSVSSNQAIQIKENRIFGLYKASIYNSPEMRRHFEGFVKQLEYCSGSYEAVSKDEVIWSLLPGVIFIEHPKSSFTGTPKDALGALQYTRRNLKFIDHAVSIEAHLALTKLGRQVVASYRGYEIQIQRLKKHWASTTDNRAKANESELQKIEIVEDHYRFRLIQLAGFEAVEQMEREVI